MKFIFPKNYNFKPKLLGIIEYSTAILNITFAIVLYFILNIFISDIFFKLSIFIILFLPLLLITVLGINQESIISIAKYLYKFFKNKRIYIYYR